MTTTVTTCAVIAAMQGWALRDGRSAAEVATAGFAAVVLLTARDGVAPPVGALGPAVLITAARKEIGRAAQRELIAGARESWENIEAEAEVLASLDAVPDSRRLAVPASVIAHRTAGIEIGWLYGEDTASMAWAGALAEARANGASTGRSVTIDELSALDPVLAAAHRDLPASEKTRLARMRDHLWPTIGARADQITGTAR